MSTGSGSAGKRLVWVVSCVQGLGAPLAGLAPTKVACSVGWTS